MALDLSNWRNYLGVLHVGTLWHVVRRGSGGSSKYPGNFIPEIPRNLIQRFTDDNDLVVDMFAGSETTADVCAELGRRYEGCDLRPYSNRTSKGDARTWQPGEQAQLVLLHPPYANIIDYNEKLTPDDADLSLDPAEFLEEFAKVASNAVAATKPGGYIALVMGDLYQNGEYYPLGFKTMSVLLATGRLKLKGTVVKNFGDEVKNKGRFRNLWFYRALKNRVFVLEHEYIFVFRKDSKLRDKAAARQ